MKLSIQNEWMIEHESNVYTLCAAAHTC